MLTIKRKKRKEKHKQTAKNKNRTSEVSADMLFGYDFTIKKITHIKTLF